MMNADLHDICTRIARIETERKELAAEVAAIKKQAKDDGYDAGLITKTVAIMLKSGKKQREALEQHELFDTYLNAVGLLTEAAIEAGRPALVVPPASPGEAAGNNVASPTHDPTTGEIHDHAETVTTSPRADGETLEPGSPSTIPISSAHCLPDDSDESLHLRSAAGEHVSSVPPRPLAGSIDMGDIPEALDRRKRQEVAA
jgi:uncharacterized protein (UPF0335 family)